MFSIFIYFKMSFIPVMKKLKFLQPFLQSSKEQNLFENVLTLKSLYCHFWSIDVSLLNKNIN